jgi:hypothetical protein
MTFDAEPVLEQLKDFQRATVERVFGRMYDPVNPALRFLVADEVGLGKTLVAKGLIAKTIEYLENRVDRVDVIYVCSNAQIAKQNVRRLQVPGVEHMQLADRITMLPIVAHELSRHKVNLVAFTPDTSFGVARGSGHMRERAVLRLMLEAVWGQDCFRGKASYRVFQGTVQTLSSFESLCRDTRSLHRRDLDEELVEAFRAGITKHDLVSSAAGRVSLLSRYESLCDVFARDRPQTGFTTKERRMRNAFVGDVRAILARSCLEALEPDLIILDEFQRFKNLLSDPNVDGVAGDVELAHELFDFVDQASGHNARVLLLSATPYKMMTVAGEVDDDHHRDLVDTFAFLVSHDPILVSQLRMDLKDLRRSLLQIGRDHGEAARAARARVETLMRKVMVRTERLAATKDRSGMLHTEPALLTLEAGDVRHFVAVAQLSRRIEAPDPMEYWKSAPYLLNYMEEYELGRLLGESIDSGGVSSIAQIAATGLLPLDDIRRFNPIEFDNARLRWLINDTVGRGAWRLLWMPPSLPYTEPTGPFAEPELQHFTKRLIFSSWRMVPRAVATLTSYEAERQMVSTSGKPLYENSVEGRRGRGSRLAFAFTGNRLTGMPVLGLLYPSRVLAELGDPLVLAADAGGRAISVEDAVIRVADAMRERLVDLSLAIEGSGATISNDGAGDETWYWAAPIWLDYEADPNRSEALFSSARRLAGAFTSDHGSPGERFIEHVQRARKAIFDSYPNLGPMPTDLAEVLARTALAGPGPVALRVLARTSDRKLSDSNLALAACRIAWSIRSLFNGPEATELVRALYDGDPYWQRVLDYSLAGNLQSVLDEYAAVLVPSLGLVGRDDDEAIDDLSRAMASSINLRTVNYAVSTFEDRKGGVRVGTERLRANFALRLGDEKTEEGTLSRAADVRDAFNSPFWPFVLVTTSAGQEGLDFHQFCHAVVHWNLPANPVDLEQREGRVHRFMGHAIRRNVAAEYRHIGLTAADPWAAMLDTARDDRPALSNDIVPYWVYEGSGEDPVRIERYVPALPLSKDRSRANTLQKSVALYRLAFGQPRQEDLIAYLGTQIDPKELESIIDDIRIDLSPEASGAYSALPSNRKELLA